jgi:hypothetical protein
MPINMSYSGLLHTQPHASYTIPTTSSDAATVNPIPQISNVSAPTASTTNPSLANTYYGTMGSSYVGAGGSSYQNIAAKTFNLGNLPQHASTLLQSLPQEWIQSASPEQLQSLMDELHTFNQNVTQPYNFNPPQLQIPIPPVVTGMPTPTQVTVTPSGASEPALTPHNSRDKNWYDSISLGSAGKAIATGRRGYNLYSTYSGIVESSEATEFLGESAIGAAEAFGSELGLEGLAIGAGEFLGGAAAVGGFIAGGEVLLGLALAGAAVYEGYKAFGGSSNFDIDQASSMFSTVSNSIQSAPEKLQQGQEFLSNLSGYASQAESFLEEMGGLSEVGSIFESASSFFP